MNHYTDLELVAQTEKLVSEERRITVQVLEHLFAIERLLLYLKYQCTSLFDFCVKHLKYSNGSAHRRIDAMSHMKELPELKPPLLSGALSVTNAAEVQSFRKAEK